MKLLNVNALCMSSVTYQLEFARYEYKLYACACSYRVAYVHPVPEKWGKIGWKIAVKMEMEARQSAEKKNGSYRRQSWRHSWRSGSVQFRWVYRRRRSSQRPSSFLRDKNVVLQIHTRHAQIQHSGITAPNKAKLVCLKSAGIQKNCYNQHYACMLFK